METVRVDDNGQMCLETLGFSLVPRGPVGLKPDLLPGT